LPKRARGKLGFGKLEAMPEDRLGHEASAGLLELLTDVRKEWTAEVIAIVGDRFEPRLVEETSKLRVDMTQGFAAIRQEWRRGSLRCAGRLQISASRS
jgi:hypothetical protein